MIKMINMDMVASTFHSQEKLFSIWICDLWGRKKDESSRSRCKVRRLKPVDFL